MITRAYKQGATYWGSPASNGTGGFTYAAPVTIKVRWEDKQIQFATQQGEIEVSKAVVFVKEDLDTGGYLYLGTSTETDPTTLPVAFLIKQIVKIPDLRNAQNERRAFL